MPQRPLLRSTTTRDIHIPVFGMFAVLKFRYRKQVYFILLRNKGYMMEKYLESITSQGVLVETCAQNTQSLISQQQKQEEQGAD